MRLKYLKSMDINILKKFFLIQIRLKLMYNTILVIKTKKGINNIETVQRKHRLVLNRCNISYMSNLNRLTKLN